MTLRLSRALLMLLTLLSASALGCAASPPARTVRVTDLGTLGDLAPGQPLVIEFRKGDTLPLVFKMAGPLLETAADTPPITLRATRRFFLRMDADGLTSSLDGKSFSERPAAPGSFQVGLGATKEGAKATITIKGPTPREAKGANHAD